jgi:predicted AlkP superfamily phosphohydrolase/phosphomutase
LKVPKNLIVFLAICGVVLSLWLVKGVSTSSDTPGTPEAQESETTRADPKLYWLIPDGMRAEPEVFDIYRWANEGKLPNIKRMMESGSYGFSIPVFPSHTPVNFATLLTGATPTTHGISDGPMHVEGQPLSSISISGFRSAARRIPAVWSSLEAAGKKVVLQSVPGSTPAEIEDGVVIRGRWGGLSGDVHAVNFETKGTGTQLQKQGRGSKLFFFGPQLTQYVDPRPAVGWASVPPSFSPALEASFSSWGATFYAYIYDSTDDGTVSFDRVLISADKSAVLADLTKGDWSQWVDVDLLLAERRVSSGALFHVIKLSPDGFFRIRILFDNLNELLTSPPSVAAELRANVGPMVDFVDNFPPQLIYSQEDKLAFLGEMHRSFDWHTKAIPFLWSEYEPDAVIHDIYSPNQMLTSRWWMGYVDPASTTYADVGEETRAVLWSEVHGMYQRLDSMVGEILETAGPGAIVVLSSDHGACPLGRWVHLNNLFAANGLLKFTIDEETGARGVDWENTRAVYLKMIGVFVHPDGLDGDWTRGKGPEYEQLREQVATLLVNLADEDGARPVTSVTKWEDVEEDLALAADRVGDLVISNAVGYGWNEEMSEGMEVFSTPLKTGYKQAILVEEAQCIWTPFMITGPGVKKGHRLSGPIRHMDQLPTILELMNVDVPDLVEGRRLPELMD